MLDGATNAKLRIPRDFRRAHGRSRDAAQIVARELLRASAGNQQQAFCLQSGWLVEQVGFERFPGDFAAGEQIGGHRAYLGVRGGDFQFRLLVFVSRSLVSRGRGVVEHDGNESFGFNFSRRRERNCRLHHKSAVLFQYRWRSGKSASGRGDWWSRSVLRLFQTCHPELGDTRARTLNVEGRDRVSARMPA